MGKQTKIPGTERLNRHRDIEEAAQDYKKLRDKHGELTRQLTRAKEELMGRMDTHQLTQYIDEDDELFVEITPVDRTVKVKPYDPEKHGIAKPATIPAPEAVDEPKKRRKVKTLAEGPKVEGAPGNGA